MSSVVLSGDTSGTVTVVVPAVAGSNTVTIPASTGTMALTSDVIGVSQTWTDVTASRAFSTSYTNSTGKPIMVFVNAGSHASGNVSVAINGTTIGTFTTDATSLQFPMSFIVQNGVSYSVARSSGGSPTSWWELR